MSIGGIIKGVKDARRIEQVVKILGKYELDFLVNRIKARNLAEKGRGDEAERLRKAFEELGGAFVKLGQLLSLRFDLVPESYCQEFRKLRDRVKPFPYSDVKGIIELELKQPMGEVFKEFESEPVAAASIGQVHRARLKTNELVAVKVQRPGIQGLMKTDIDVLYYIARLLERRIKTDIVSPTGVVKEFEDYTNDELNYVKEAKNISRFYRNFAKIKTTRIPRVFWKYTTTRVLTMEFIEGEKISEINLNDKSLNRKAIAKMVTDSVFRQIFDFGVFHADPHPGNIVLGKGHITLLDFGIVGHLDERLRQRINRLFISLAEHDLDEAANSLLNLGICTRPIDREAFKEDIYSELGEYYDTTLIQVDLSVLLNKLVRLARAYRLRLPVGFVLLGKSLLTTEGLCKELNPKLNIMSELKPFVEHAIAEKRRPAYMLKRAWKKAYDMKEFLNELPEKTSQMSMEIHYTNQNVKYIHNDLRRLDHEIDTTTNRITIGLIVTGLLITSALTMNSEQVRFMNMPLFSSAGFLIAGAMIIILFRMMRE
ncbi:hypothetical protein COT48_01410 [Candidatus Woesearchaeota archaeon CG08_land_8_20_14_0_20_47_9]|nr:MAG: hypothetical protein COT48_01410 [Candidatus Woesearchaeota archaeon CG08_land_8_20_14_0_20_47_9]